MGRLTLNVLLSFAQYERECIRDKIAGSRCAASAEITPCVYDERPRLPVGLAVVLRIRRLAPAIVPAV